MNSTTFTGLENVAVETRLQEAFTVSRHRRRRQRYEGYVGPSLVLAQPMIDPKVVEALVAENARGVESPNNQLSRRERDVLREMAEGKNNAAIAEALFLTERPSRR